MTTRKLLNLAPWGTRAAILNRRVAVENYLLRVSQGKLPLPTREDCAALALVLGTPVEFQTPTLKRRDPTKRRNRRTPMARGRGRIR